MATLRDATAADVDPLAALLMACARDGASLGFLDTMTLDEAVGYWIDALRESASRRRFIVVAIDGDEMLGTASVIRAPSANQQHRGELAKLMVSPAHQREGLGTILLLAAEGRAWSEGRTLLVLDTEAGSPAEDFYAGHGWTKTGEIPDYALTARGRLHPTAVYWKRSPAAATTPGASPVRSGADH